MDPYLVLEKVPATPGQGFPYLYLEPGVSVPSVTDFASVTLDIYKFDREITIEVGECP